MFEKLTWADQVRLAALMEANKVMKGCTVGDRIKAADKFETYIREGYNGES